MASHPAAEADKHRAAPCTGGSSFVVAVDPLDGREPLLAFISDHSDTSMRIKLADELPLPEAVDVIMREGRRRARVAWRKDGKAGLEFTGTFRAKL